MESNERFDLSALTEDADAMQRLGRRVLVEAVRAAAEERSGRPPSGPAQRQYLSPGDEVPQVLADVNVEMDAGGRARGRWEKTWQDWGPWERTWSEKGGRHVEVPAREVDEDLLNDSEKAILRRLQSTDQ